MEDRTVMRVVPYSEQRVDEARLSLALEGAPILEYTYRHWRGTGYVGEERRWQPDYAMVVWEVGVLVRVRVSGRRLRKDGTVGKVADSFTFYVDDEGFVKPLVSEDFRYPVAWVQKLIDVYPQCPAHGTSGPRAGTSFLLPRE